MIFMCIAIKRIIPHKSYTSSSHKISSGLFMLDKIFIDSFRTILMANLDFAFYSLTFLK